MEECTELENQTEQGSQPAVVQVEDREDENEKQWQKGEESRANETRAEQIKERERKFILEKAIALMEGILKDRSFIAERGFKQVISPSAEMLEKRG